MAALARFKDIMAANINALLDRVEDPAKMVDQYLVNMAKDLAEVKRETAAVMAEEARCKRLVDENRVEVAKFMGLAEKALMAQNEGDARVFLNKKQELEAAGAGLATAYEVSRGNAEKMRQMHDKLVRDINDLTARKNTIKAKAAVAKTQERVNKFEMPSAGRSGAAAFDRMEAKVNQKLDAANAMAELNREPIDEAKALEEKYKSGTANASVDNELAALKAKLGM
ncbi:MAG: PspA/IM30 family protein [Defluviitaleaceae bacterium]|nr:PspA/IM30 family protein [Defluviitaleaceae bacterium]